MFENKALMHYSLLRSEGDHQVWDDYERKKTKVSVPASAVKAYKNDYRWSESGKIVAM